MYNTTIHPIVACLEDRYDQPGYKMYSTLEQLLLKACRKENHGEVLATITKQYSSDILMADLRIQLQTLSTTLNSDDSVSLRDVVKYLGQFPKVAQSLYA